jgi:hypothetical protein
VIRFRKVAFSFGAAVAALSALTLLAPRTAHAVAAALVQVPNTTANPAITQDTSKQAGQLIHLQSNVPPTIFAVVPMSFTSISVGLGSTANYSVPNNQTLVLTSIDITAFGCPASPIRTIDLFNNIGTVEAWTVPGATTNSFMYAFLDSAGTGNDSIGVDQRRRVLGSDGVRCSLLMESGASVLMDMFSYLTSS